MKASETFSRLLSRPPFNRLVDEVQTVIGPVLEPYLAELGPDFELGGAKSIKDAVWGMIDLTPQEIVVIDSPPMQRLRRIRQLGVSFLTYPTAGYSRFEHSLGALRQAERMLVAISTRSNFKADLNEARPTVRLAALLHDVGNMPLSHVSERYYSEEECSHAELLELAQNLTSDTAECLLVTEPSLAECLSAAVIASKDFNALLRHKAGYDKETIAAAALAILGKTPTVRNLFVSQLITNVVDADKLDYMFRDGFVTRVPLAVDLERLMFKLTCVEVPADKLWGSLARSAKAGERALVIGTDATGQEITYDLAAARKLLYERIYFHPKTRAAERVAMRALDSVALRPAQLLDFDDGLFSRYGAERFPEEVGRFARRLMNRRLPRRIFALADDFIDRELIARQSSPAGTVEATRLRHAVTEATSRAELELRISEEAKSLAHDLGGVAPSDVWIDLPPDAIGTGDARLPEVTPDGEVILGPSYPPGAAAAVQNPLPTTFIFVTEANADSAIAHLAAQRVLAREFGLYFTARAAVRAKVSSERVEALKHELQASDPDAFKGLRGLRPPSLAAHGAYLAARIDGQARRFQHFTNDTGVRVDAERIRTFLDQFGEDLVEPMLCVIEAIHWLDRPTLGKGFAERLIADGGDGALFVPLTTEYGKSANHLPYFLSDHPGNVRIVRLDEALAEEGPIVIFDDVLISGVQAKRVVDTWFGDDDLKSAQALNDEQRKALLHRSPLFRFAYAWTVGLDALRTELHKRGVSGSVEALRTDETPQPLDAAGPAAEGLRSFLSEVGYAVLKSTKGSRGSAPWTDERCTDSALGYGNDERLVVLEYNTPTGSITALWKDGVFDGARWLPLFPRRETSA